MRLGLGDAVCYTAGRYTLCAVLYLVRISVSCVCFLYLCLSMPGIAARPVCVALCLWDASLYVCWMRGCRSLTWMGPAGACILQEVLVQLNNGNVALLSMRMCPLCGDYNSTVQ